MPGSTWEDALRGGDLSGALALVKSLIREKTNDGDLRLALVHLAALAGDWGLASRQIRLYEDLSADEERHLLAMLVMSLIRCEEQRLSVLEGRQAPLIFGEPPPWIADLIQMHGCLRDGRYDAASRCRKRVVDLAIPVPGTIDRRSFEWLGDTDSRFCAIFEAMIGSNYYWLPTERLRWVTSDGPKTFRDLIWLPVNFGFTNGGEAPGYISVRYPGSDSSERPDLALSRATEWDEPAPGFVVARGHRILTDGESDFPILDIRRIELESCGTEPSD